MTAVVTVWLLTGTQSFLPVKHTHKLMSMYQTSVYRQNHRHWTVFIHLLFVSRCCGSTCEVSTSCLCCEGVDRHPPLHLWTTKVLWTGWKRGFYKDRQSPLVSEPFDLSWVNPVCVRQWLNEQRPSLQIPRRHDGKLHVTDHRYTDGRQHDVSIQNGSWAQERTFYWTIRSGSHCHW